MKDAKLCSYCLNPTVLKKVFPLPNTGSWVYQCPVCKMIDADFVFCDKRVKEREE